MSRIIRRGRRLSLDESLECLTGAMESHLDCGCGNDHHARGLFGVQFFDKSVAALVAYLD